MKKILTALAIAATAAPAFAVPDTYTIDSRHTFPVFEVNHLGYSTQRGRFDKTTGKITLDTVNKYGSIDVTIDAASIDMGFEDWNKHMRSEDFFNTAQFPTISFKSDRILFDGDKPVAAEGSFTMLGVTKPVHLSINSFKCGLHPINRKVLCGADVSTTIKRTDFGMTKYAPAISDEVKISIPVEAFKD